MQKPSPLLTRWLIQELAGPILGVFVGFLLFSLLAMDLYQMVDLIAAKRVPPLVVHHLLMLRLPFWVVFAIPVSLLFGLFLGVSRLAQDGELRAVRTLGVSRRLLFGRLVLVGLALSVASFVVQERAVPGALERFFQIVARFSQSDLLRRVEPGRFVAGPKRMHYYFGSVCDEDEAGRTGCQFGTLEDVRILRLGPSNAPEELITSARGEIEGDTLRLVEGRVVRFADDGTRVKARESFALVEVDLAREFAELVPQIDNPLVDSAATLARKVREHRALDHYSPSLLRREETELQYRFSLPLANLVFVLFSFPLALRMGKAGRLQAFFLAVMAFTVYWGLINIGRTMGYGGALSPLLAGWLPNALFLGVGLALLAKDPGA